MDAKMNPQMNSEPRKMKYDNLVFFMDIGAMVMVLCCGLRHENVTTKN